MIAKTYLYAGAAIAFVAVSGGLWLHGYNHGLDVERGRTAEAIAQARAQDAREIEKLRTELQRRRRVVTKTVEVIRNVQDDTPCQCFDAPAPDDVYNSMFATYNALVRPETHGALSVCRVPLTCDAPYYYSGARPAVGDGGRMRQQDKNITGEQS